MTEANGNDSKSVLMDDQKKAQPLLEQFGILILPVDIDDAAYVEMTWALAMARHLHPDKRLELRCHGDGGATDVMLALSDLIQIDGRVDGIMLGDGGSASSVIWAACSRRFVYPNAAISVHDTIQAGGEWRDATYRQTLLDRQEWFTERVVGIYASASKKSKAWWRKKLEAGHGACTIMDADELIEIGMAQPVSEREV